MSKALLECYTESLLPPIKNYSQKLRSNSNGQLSLANASREPNGLSFCTHSFTGCGCERLYRDHARGATHRNLFTICGNARYVNVPDCGGTSDYDPYGRD